jgi:hypothetical protein
MMRSKVWGMIALVGALTLACSDSTGVTEDALIGTWNATEFVFSDFEDPVTDFDVLGEDGSVEMEIRANGTYTITINLGFGAETLDGTWELQGDDLLILTEEGTVEEIAFEVSLEDTTLTVYSDDIEFDFGDGDIPAQLNAVFTKE